MAKKKANIESFDDVKFKAQRLETLMKLSNEIRDKERRKPILFNDFLYIASVQPHMVFRNIFQLFHDMVINYSEDREITDDAFGFVKYDFSRLFRVGCEDPFFADKLFANRFMNLVKSFAKGAQTNRIYLFEGPPGSGKSIFLNNLLQKLEEYTKTTEGTIYKTIWHIDIDKITQARLQYMKNHLLKDVPNNHVDNEKKSVHTQSGFLEISCPNNDHPILMIPKSLRKNFLEELIPDADFKQKLVNDIEFAWVLKESPCGICSSIYNYLLDILDNPMDVFNMIHPKKTVFNRQFGQGISVFNPGDERMMKPISNSELQQQINDLLGTDDIKYQYSDLANTNNGVFALMDIKENNVERLKSLHGIISDGVHKVELMEERVRSLFLGIINPEDKKHYENVKSFQDRIITLNIPYVLDYSIEVSIYRKKFGNEIEHYFLPAVLDNFARIIIATRLSKESLTIKNWIMKPDKYSKYLDKDMLLLKMEIYSGNLPDWLIEEDMKKFDHKIRRELLCESENEGRQGLSGRKSLSLFNSFLNKYYKHENLITMEMVEKFFANSGNELSKVIPDDFVQSLVDMYDYTIIQQIKDAIYNYNKKQVSRDILNYLYCINYDVGEKVKVDYTGDKITISEEFFKSIEVLVIGLTSTLKERKSFRNDMANEYVTKTLAQEIRVGDKDIVNTEQFKSLLGKYTKNLKEFSLAPYIESVNFRRAIQAFDTNEFKSYDNRLRKDVSFMIRNLEKKYGYTRKGACQVCIYALDKKLATKF